MLAIKVCGMKHPDNIEQLEQLQVDYLGFICYAQSPRYIHTDNARFIRELATAKVGVFVNATHAEIYEFQALYNFQYFQLHGQESPEYCAALKALNIPIIKAFGIDDTFDWNTVDSYDSVADYFLFDTKSPKHGGTGTSFNWELLKKYPLEKPYFLSGGLSISNIKEATNFEDPRLIALDLNSKFELSPALKDIKLLEETFKIIRNEQVSS